MSRRITIHDLLPDPRNPRRISDDALGGLQASLRAFGDVSGLTWNRRTGELVAGHQRLSALKREAERRGVDLAVEGDTDPAIVLPAGGGQAAERFRLRVVDWSRAEQAAANIAANNPAIGGDFSEGLADLLSEVETDFPDLFDEARFGELTALADGMTAPTEEDWGSALGGLEAGDKAPIQQMTFTLHDEQAETVKAALEAAKSDGPFADTGNANSNGNALARICEWFVGGR